VLNTFQGLHARYYDLIYATKPYAAEARFVQELLGEPGSLLDVACGSARHALEFARLGWSVTGVDYSPDLLERGRANAGAAGLEIPLHEQDMRELDVPGGPFDAITCLFDSIGYPQDNEGIVAALDGIRRHLAPRGRVAVEFLHAPALLRHAEALRVRRHELPDGGTLLRISETRLDPAAQVMHVDYEVVELRPDGGYARESARQSNRFFGVDEMRALLTASGLAVENFVAAYQPEGAEIGEETFHVIAVAVAA
jgi:SAM-dependent methyltransferase